MIFFQNSSPDTYMHALTLVVMRLCALSKQCLSKPDLSIWLAEKRLYMNTSNVLAVIQRHVCFANLHNTIFSCRVKA